MLALITSCGRFDLLKKTIDSLIQSTKKDLILYVNEDSKEIDYSDFKKSVSMEVSNFYIFNYTYGIGQHKSIEEFLLRFNAKYYLHIEDDWQFESNYDWIAKSIEIMESDPSIIKVICRSDSPHPRTFNDKGFAILEPWRNSDGDLWCGFGWNPGVTRLDLLKTFPPFGLWEQDVSEAIHNAGYRTALLENGVCKHIGDGRSTHA